MSAPDMLHPRYGVRHFDEGGSTNDPIAGLYSSVLGRDTPDAPGLKYWQSQLASGMSLADIESAFKGSQEYQQNQQAVPAGNLPTGNVTVQSAGSEYDNAQPITPTYGSTAAIQNWYDTNLGRQADPTGLQYWSSAFGDTLDPNEIAQLQASPEYMNRQAVSGFYDTELGRKAVEDQAGLDYWTNAANTGTPLDVIRQGIGGSSEGQAFDIKKLYTDELGRQFDAPGLEFYQGEMASGKSLEDIQKAFNESKEGLGFDIRNLYTNVLGRKPGEDEAGLKFWLDAIESGIPREEILKSFEQAPEYEVAEDYVNYLGRTPDAAGLKNYMDQLASGKSAVDIEREIALSQESVGLNSPSVKAVLEATLGKDIVSQMTPDQIAEYTKVLLDPSRTIASTQIADQNTFNAEYYLAQNPDVAAAGVDPYSHYLQHGFNEGRAPNEAAPATQDDKLREVFREIALDPVLGPKLKAENPLLWEQVTPLTGRPEDFVRTDRTVYGQYGTVEIGGAKVPILSAAAADRILSPGNSATVSDFSHSRGNLVSDLGWSSNSFSGDLSRGANALGVTEIIDPETGKVSYTGLNEAAGLINLDPSQFQDKQVPLLSKEQRDEYGNVIQAAGQPVYQTDNDGNTVFENGQPVPAMQTITADSQLYDAISNAAKDIYRYTGDSLTPGQGYEGGPKSFDTVFYKRTGDELIPISAPNSHGGQQNLDIYRPKDFGFSYYAQGPAFVAAAAISFAMADPTLSLATAVGNAILPAAASTAIGATATGIVGATVLGAATGALSSTAAGGNIEKGALTGAVTGLVASSMKPLLSSQPMLKATQSIAEASQNVFSQAQVGNIIGATLASTLASAASGANGNQILNSFTTALISSGLSEKAAQLAVAGVKEAFGDDPKTLARTAAATKLVTRTASTAALSGKSPEQIQAAVIATLVQNAASIVGTGSSTTAPKTTQVSSAEYDGLVDALGGKEQADAYLAGLNQDTGVSPYASTASVGDTPLVKTPTGTVTVTSVNDIDPNAPVAKAQALSPEDEAEYQEQVAAQDAKVAQQEADNVSKVADAIALPNADISSIVSVITNMFKVPQKTATIAANMAKSGATAAQISKVIGTGVTGTGVTGTDGDGPGGDGINIDGVGPGTNTSTTPRSPTTPAPRTPTTPTPTTPVRRLTVPQIRASQAVDNSTGIYDLTPGLTRARTDYQLAGQFKMAAGGTVATQYDPFGLSRSTYGTSDNAGIADPSSSPFVGSDIKMPRLKVGMTKRNVGYDLPAFNPKFMAEGGLADHNPQFFSEGGLGTLENRYVQGDGDGTSDEVPAMLANGEFVIPADVVAALGNGSNEAGASVLDQLLQVIREHRQDHDPEDLPPDSAGPLAYLLEAKERA